LAAEPPQPALHAAPALPVFLASLGLGCSSFGGPVAHLGYFRRAYVERRGWLDAPTFGGIVALCQVLPGPTSSQVGFLVGWHRAGWRGALAAWFGFTLPSALVMYAMALAAPRWHGAVPAAVVHGLQLAAIAVVAQAVWMLARAFCRGLPRALFALAAGTALIVAATPLAQLAVLLVAAVAGARLLRVTGTAPVPAPAGEPRGRTAAIALGAFVALLLAAMALLGVPSHGIAALAGIFYRAGACVFGGGHVVLPLLRDSLVPQGWLSDATFLAGYGAAQALPGPLFTFSAYLGASVAPAGAAPLWALLAVVAIFLPGLLIAAAGAALWGRVTQSAQAQAALAGINAAVVGVLAAALCNPLLVTGVHGLFDAAVGLVALWLLQARRVAPLIVVAGCVAAALAGAGARV
jgi:chromate transporter